MRILKPAAAGTTVALAAGLCATVPAAAVTPVADPVAVKSVKAALPDPWADEAGASVSVAGGKKSFVEAAAGDELRVVMRNIGKGVVTTDAGQANAVARSKIAAEFGKLKGRPKGVLVGKTTAGKAISIPVVFTSDLKGAKKQTVTVKPVDGNIPDELANVFPQLSGVDAESVGSRMRYVGIHATDGGAQSWRLSAATRAGSLKSSGSEFTVRLPKVGKRGVGVQMGKDAVGVPWSYVGKNWDTVNKGVAPMVIVQGVGKKGVTRTVALRPDSIKDGKSLVFRGDALSSLKGKAKKALRTMRGAAVTLVASNPGHDTNYVVITGDSISSGESGRYVADFEAANAFDGLDPLSAKKVCDYVDLACESAEDLEGLDAVFGSYLTWEGWGKYEQKLTKVYEKGTQGTGECHRSYSAPGTWLARYFEVEQGDKVESINIACSGATTDAMTEPFNGQRPQAEVLAEITNVVHVPYVTNTMGANDIGFSAVAIGCFMKIAAPFLSSDSADEDMLSKVGQIIDAPWNPWFGMAKVKGEDKYEFVNPYCHNDPQIGGAAEKAIGALPKKYKAAMNELLDAAPKSKIVAANYPNLIPHNSQSNFPKARALADGGPIETISDTFMFFNNAFPAKPDFDSWTFDELKANKDKWAKFWVNNLTGYIASQALQYQLMSTMNLLLEKDMNWAAWKMIPGLNDAVFDTAGGMGKRVMPVDMREVLNGRQHTTPYKGGPGVDDPKNLGSALSANLGGQAHMGLTWDRGQKPESGEPTDQLRATFVTSPLAGLPMEVPVLCPPEMTLNGKKMTDTCLGAMNEPLHPNFRGQAAQGQCYVAVVTGMAGEGNACVRSVGDNEWQVPTGEAVQVSWNASIESTDQLCVKAKPRTDYDWKDPLPAEPYTNCSSGLAADPTWDTKRWALVEQRGNWK